jgi:cytochrome c556
MFGRYVKAAIAAALVVSLSGGIVAVAQAQADVIKARQDNRKALNSVGREAFKIIKAEGDLAELAVQANKMAELNKAFGALFPPGSDTGDTLAAPAIWTDRAGFDAMNKASVDATLKLAELAKAGDRSGVAEQSKVVGKSCGECHRAYTKSDPFKK